MSETHTMKPGNKKRRTKHLNQNTMAEQRPVETEPINAEQLKIIQWLKIVRFKKRILGGVSEADVWKKIGELNTMYEAALSAERIRYDTMIEHYRKTCRINILRYKEQYEQVDSWNGEAHSGEKVSDGQN